MSTETYPKDIPGLETEFELEVKGILTGQTYKGTFKYKIPNLQKMSQISIMEARLNEGLVDQLNPSTSMTHYMIAYLNYTLTGYPSWWKESNKGFELFDANVISELYQKCIKYENEWQKTTFGDARPTE